MTLKTCINESIIIEKSLKQTGQRETGHYKYNSNFLRNVSKGRLLQVGKAIEQDLTLIYEIILHRLEY